MFLYALTILVSAFLLFQVQPRDTLTIGTAVLVVVLTSPAALWLPLRRSALCGYWSTEIGGLVSLPKLSET